MPAPRRKSTGRAIIGGVLLALHIAEPLMAAPPPPPTTAQCKGVAGYAASFGGRHTWLWMPDQLAANKAAIARRDAAILPAYDALIADADRALRDPAPRVTHKPVGEGDPHEFRSIGPYWWPDASKPGGLPYVRRDGHINPEYFGAKFDRKRLETMRRSVEALALAYYYTGDRRYAQGVARYVRTWFLDPATRMNPNLDFAQAVPGASAGRPFGLVEALDFLPLVESVGLIAPAHALSHREEKALHGWFGAFARWMTTSPLGREDAATTNNHALHYDVMLTQFSLFAGDVKTARATAAVFGERRVATQVAADGRLPAELGRTRSYRYSAFAVNSMLNMAQLGGCLGVDLWHGRTANGRSIRDAVDYLAGYAGREAAWPWPQLPDDDPADHYAVFRRAWPAWSDPLHARAAALYYPANRTARMMVEVGPPAAVAPSP